MPKTPQSGGYAKNKGMETLLTKKWGERPTWKFFLEWTRKTPKWGKGVEMEGSKNGGMNFRHFFVEGGYYYVSQNLRRNMKWGTELI